MATAEVISRSARAGAAGDEPLYEIVNGEQVEVSPMAVRENGLASFLCGYINQVTRPRHGAAVVETLFVLSRDPSLQRRSDVAYVSYERWPQRALPVSNAWDVIPNLAVEVVSPTNMADEIETKRVEYLEAGVELVWIIYSATQTIHVCTERGRITVLAAGDELDGGSVVRGFRMPVADLFGDVQGAR